MTLSLLIARRIGRRAVPIALTILAACSDSTAPDITPAAIVIISANGTLASGISANLSAVVRNAAGDVIPKPAVQWTSNDPSIAKVSDNGVVTGVHVGITQIWASVGTMRSLGIFVTVTAGAAAKIAIRTQPSGAASGLALTTQPVLEIRDDADNLVLSTLTVTATIATGGGTVTGATVTSTDGVASFTALTVTGTIGARTITFNAPGLAAATSAPVALTAGAATHLAIRTQPAGAASGAPLAIPPQVEVRDAAENVVRSLPVTVTAAFVVGSGKITGATATSVDGVATFTGMSISGTAGSRTFAFTSAGLVAVNSTAFALEPGPPTQLRVRTQPNGALPGKALTTQPAVEIDDDAGNRVASNTTVTAAIAEGGGSLTGEKAVADTGLATFTTLTITGPLGPRSLTFTVPGLPPVTSATFSLTSGGATKLAFRVGPTGAVSGKPLATQPVVEVRDDNENIVSSYVGTVTATVPGGSALVASGSADVVNGVATFSSLTLTGPGTPTVFFQSGILPPLTVPIFVGSGSPPPPPSGAPVARLVVLQAPALAAPNGVPLSPQPIVQALDASNRPVAGATISITTDAVSGTITNGSAVTNASGIATFTGITLSGPLGARNYWFVSGSAPITGIYRITITP